MQHNEMLAVMFMAADAHCLVFQQMVYVCDDA